LDDRGREGRPNFILRIKEQETRLTLQEHDDDDDIINIIIYNILLIITFKPITYGILHLKLYLFSIYNIYMVIHNIYRVIHKSVKHVR